MEFSRQEYWSGFPFPSPICNQLRRKKSRVITRFLAWVTCVMMVSEIGNERWIAWGTKKKYNQQSIKILEIAVPIRHLVEPWTWGSGAQERVLNLCRVLKLCSTAISSYIVPFSSCPQSLPASESFPMSHLFAWGGQSTGVSASASFLPRKSQGWSPSEWIGWISLQSKGLSRVFSNTTVQKHQFFGAQPSSQSNSHIHTWLLEKP